MLAEKTGWSRTMMLLMQSAAIICILKASMPQLNLLAIPPAMTLAFRLSQVLQISSLMVHYRRGRPVKE
ncbi:hypothetical protein [Synechococcus sp. BO 8801]|uniref:hypothetical protein n=1 Tax=Synechococcus sp. BO 8801 TaxID=169670 RepID=UPI00117FE5BE|nr:hypothetical protein [Synechococcus sp. BO 8801]